MKSPYKLSKDYVMLFKLLCKGFTAVGFVDYNFRSLEGIAPPSRDVVKIIREKEFEISFRVRGIGYGNVEPWHQAKGTEKELFIAECKRLNLEYIDVHL